MSQSSPEELTREELESEVGQLRERMRQTQTDVAFLKKALVTLTDADLGDELGVRGLSDAAERTRAEIDDLETAVASHGETLEMIADVGEDKTSEEEKLGAIVAYANQARGNSSKVLITPKEIAGATGCSKRYGYDLVDEIGGLREDGTGGCYDEGEYPWAAVRKAQTVPAANGGERKEKGLKIDFDRVQQDPDALNWFNNGTEGEEGR